MSGVVDSMNSSRSRRRILMSVPQARNTLAADSLSSSASNRCSTVMNSWRLLLAPLNAWLKVTSRSRLNILIFLASGSVRTLAARLDFAHQRMLMLPSTVHHLGGFGLSYVTTVDSAYRFPFS